MKTRHLAHKIAGVILGFTVLCGIGFGGSASGQDRRNRRWDGYPNWGGSYDLRQTALNAGFNDGSKEGRNDRNRGRHSDYSNFSAYEKATKDYSSKLGDRDLYGRYFRLAFERGYDTENSGFNNRDLNDRDRNNNRARWGRNWDLYGKFGGSYQLRQTALNAGYNEGIKQGRNDRKKSRHSNYEDFSPYRDATQDYSSKLGDRELYRRYYRQGFENGYEDGWNGY